MHLRGIALVAVLLAGAACGGDATAETEAADTTTAEQSADTTAAEQPAPTSTVAESESETTPAGEEGGDTGVENTAVDACDLLTEDEVAAVIGGPADIDNEDVGGYDAACYWETADEDGIYAQVAVELADLGEFAQEEYENWTELVTIVEESVSLGDEAFLGLYSVGGSQLVVRDGTLLLFVSTTEEGHEETIKTYGSLVLDRLG